jgi:hypothetical protein
VFPEEAAARRNPPTAVTSLAAGSFGEENLAESKSLQLAHIVNCGCDTGEVAYPAKKVWFPMKKLMLALLVIAAGHAVFAQPSEPIKFRGAYIAEPLSDYVDCSSGKSKIIREGYKTHGKLCEGKRGVVFHTKTKGIMNPKTEGEGLWFENQKLFRISIMVPNEDWEKVRYDITEKMGPPTSEVPQVYQNGFGARWEYDQGFWVKDNIAVCAGIQVLAGIEKAFGPGPATDGIQITITDAEHAKLPSTRPNSLD